MAIGNFQKLLATNEFLFSTILFTIVIFFFFVQSVFCSLSNHRESSLSNQEQCSLYCSSPCVHVFCALATGRCNAFQHIFVN